MDRIYYFTGFGIIWIFIIFVVFCFVSTVYIEVRDWLKSKDVFNYYIFRGTMDTEEIRELFSLYYTKLPNNWKRWAFRYRLRNIKKCRKK